MNDTLAKANGTEFESIVSTLYTDYENFVRYQELEGLYEFYCPADTPSIGTSAGGIVMIIISFILVLLVAFGTLLDGTCYLCPPPPSCLLWHSVTRT